MITNSTQVTVKFIQKGCKYEKQSSDAKFVRADIYLIASKKVLCTTEFPVNLKNESS